MGVVDANVLVLNLDFQPLNVCNVRRAVVLLSKEKASVVEQNGHLITSERLSFPSPSVIRLAYHVKRPRPVVKMTRKEVLVRDDAEKTAARLYLHHLDAFAHEDASIVECLPADHADVVATGRKSRRELVREAFRPAHARVRALGEEDFHRGSVVGKARARTRRRSRPGR